MADATAVQTTLAPSTAAYSVSSPTVASVPGRTIVKSGKGRTIRPSGARQSVIELLRFAGKVPAIPQLRRMTVPRLARVRANASVRISWPMLFFAAYARVCSRRPELRRVFVRWPYTRYYEHPVTIGRMTVAREVGGEDVVLLTLVVDAESQTLAELDAELKEIATGVPEEVPMIRWQRLLNRVPWPLKTLGWKTLLWSGPWRTQWLGTFGVTTVSKFGGMTLAPPTFNTTMLSFGPVGKAGDVDVVLSYDHRVLDGAVCAQAMAELERELETAIADELESLQPGGERSTSPA